MYIYIHLVQCSSGIEAKFAAETKQLCNVMVTARADAIYIHPLYAAVGLQLTSIILVWHQLGPST